MPRMRGVLGRVAQGVGGVAKGVGGAVAKAAFGGDARAALTGACAIPWRSLNKG